jgi:hypothetical protein
MTQAGLILKHAPIGPNLEDYDVLDNGVVVGRILFISAAGPADRQWMWASGHNGDIGARLRANARGGDGGVQEELAGDVSTVVLTPQHTINPSGQRHESLDETLSEPEPSSSGRGSAWCAASR